MARLHNRAARELAACRIYFFGMDFSGCDISHPARFYAVVASDLPSAACAAASLAIGTRNGEQET